MNEILKMKCELMGKNYKMCRKAGKLEESEAVSLAALVYTGNNKYATEEEIRANRKILKSRASIFSNMRGYTNEALLASMAGYDDPADYLDKVITAYDLIKGKIVRSEYMTLAAQAIAETVEPDQFVEMAEKTHQIWKKMQSNHLLLTGFEDYSVASMLAVANVDIDEQLEEAERCYNELKTSGFLFNKDTLQTAAHVLALSDKPWNEKCDKFREIRDALKAAKHPIRWEQLAVISAFCGTDIPVDTIVQEVADADDTLKHIKGFGPLACGRQLRRLYACALVLQTHEIEIEQNASKIASRIANTTVQLIIHAIMRVIVTSSVVNCASANSSSSQG